MKSKPTHRLLAIAAFAMLSCNWSKDFVRRSDLVPLVNNVNDLRQDLSDLSQALTALGCSEDVRQTLADLRKACEEQRLREDQSQGIGSCDAMITRQVLLTGQVKHPKDPKFWFRNLESQKHIVLYAANPTDPIDPERMKQLIAFLRIPVLKKTRFLIATSDKPDLGLAKARTRNVMNLLRSMNVSAEHVDESDLITYDYFAPVMLKDLREEDKPMSGGSRESKVPMNRGVWIYRLDCIWP